jgi:hypothetical protein
MTAKPATNDQQGLKGWFIAGDQPADYEVGVDQAVAHSGQASGYIKSRHYQRAGFGTLMQMCQATSYRGQRVRMSAYAKASAVKTWAGLWMRVDGAEGKMLSFDNMMNRPIKGMSDWNRYEIVLDVPPDSLYLAFGVLLTGRGQVWVDDFAFEVVGSDVPLTGDRDPIYQDQPSNLGFEG